MLWQAQHRMSSLQHCITPSYISLEQRESTHLCMTGRYPQKDTRAWVFPPRALILTTLRRLVERPCNAVLLVPPPRQAWLPLIAQLPVVNSFLLKWHPQLYRAGVRAPKEWAGVAPVTALMAYRLRL